MYNILTYIYFFTSIRKVNIMFFSQKLNVLGSYAVSTGNQLSTFRIVTAFIFKVKWSKTVLGRFDLESERAWKTSENAFLTTRCNVQNVLTFQTVWLLRNKASCPEETLEVT